jgi:hypothetical protein
MGYSVAVERVCEQGSKHVYAYGREGGSDGYLTLDTATGRIYVSDEHGTASAEAFIAMDGSVEHRGGLPVEPWSRFIEAAIGVIKGFQRETGPPAVAHRIFG